MLEKRSVKIFLVFGIAMILCLGAVSAFSFSDLWDWVKGNSISFSPSACVDSDGGNKIFDAGKVTLDKSEFLQLKTTTGETYYVLLNTNHAGTTPIYYLYNEKVKGTNYLNNKQVIDTTCTQDKKEMESLKKKGYKSLQKTNYYAFSKQQEGSIPLYRYKSIGTSELYYTTLKKESLNKVGYKYEGVVAYVFPKASYVYNDVCSSDKKSITEYFCSGNGAVKSVSAKCDNGCSSRACVKAGEESTTAEVKKADTTINNETIENIEINNQSEIANESGLDSSNNSSISLEINISEEVKTETPKKAEIAKILPSVPKPTKKGADVKVNVVNCNFLGRENSVESCSLKWVGSCKDIGFCRVSKAYSEVQKAVAVPRNGWKASCDYVDYTAKVSTNKFSLKNYKDTSKISILTLNFLCDVHSKVTCNFYGGNSSQVKECYSKYGKCSGIDSCILDFRKAGIKNEKEYKENVIWDSVNCTSKSQKIPLWMHEEDKEISFDCD